MAQSVKIENNLPQWKRRSLSVLADALREGARDTLVVSRNRAPYDKGSLRRNSDIKSINPLHWRVSYWTEYARFQEFGGDSKRRVRNYSTPGTGKEFLRSSGDMTAKRLRSVFKKHAGRV